MKIKDYIKYMMCGVVAILVGACTTDEQEWVSAKDLVQVVGRVTEFKDHTVTSRALKTNEESKISNMSLFIFEENGSCVSRQFVNSSRPVFVIDRSKLTGTLDKARIYMLANVTDMETGMNSINDLDDLNAYVCKVESIHEVPDEGFPMMGHMDDVDLTQGNSNLSAVLEIPLTNLYAKMVFNLQVNTIQEVMGYVPAFRLESWEVHNVPTTVALAESEMSNVEDYHSEVFVSNESTGSNPVSGSNTLSFSFYLPEHKVNANTWSDYPAGIADDERQRFKPMRVMEGTKPTFVRIKGSFTNHQGHMLSVSYDIYLGLDNWQNFQVLRNYQYNNNIVIRGITNSTDGVANTISVDHRVNVERSEFSVAMERETMLDCHFEVRPMRVTLNDGGKVVAKVQSGCDWIRLETRSTGGADYCSNGKRKYFTTTLMNNLSNTAEVTSNSNNCIWAYIDENVDVTKAQDGVRTATVTFNYYADANNTTTPDKTETYTFAQRYLYPITVKRPDGSTHTYYIEYFEEYLHDFDSENDFNQTDYEGMAWGLENVWLSNKYKAAYVDDTNGNFWTFILSLFGWDQEDFINGLSSDDTNSYYDFYLSRDNPYPDSEIRDYKGYQFCEEIVATADIGTKTLTLDDLPQSAVEYCYNKNKRNPDTGLVQTAHWYLPAIDEIEEITMGAYTVFNVFQENYYWSSQPAYINNDLSITGTIVSGTGEYSSDDITRARATKVVYKGNNSQKPYINVESGTAGKSGKNVGKVENIGSFWSPKYTIDYTYSPYNNPEVTLGEGNMLRSKKNRIRAVYKP